MVVGAKILTPCQDAVCLVQDDTLDMTGLCLDDLSEVFILCNTLGAGEDALEFR